MVHLNPYDFFRALYPDPIKPGRLALLSRTHRRGAEMTYWCHGLREVSRLTQRYRNTRELRFGVALQDPKQALAIARRRRPRATPGSVRGCEPTATALPALWAEIPFATWHSPERKPKIGPGPPDLRAALSLLEAVPTPSVVMGTGDALTCLWLFEELWELRNSEERARARARLHRLRWALAARASENGWRIELGRDLAECLLVPGTRSRTGLEMSVERFPLSTAEARYRPEHFDALPEPPPGSERAWPTAETCVPRAVRESLSSEGPPVGFEAVAEGCSWLRHCFANSAALPRDAWQAALSLVGRCKTDGADGRQLAHELSRAHPGYSRLHTDAQLAQVLRPESEACSCHHISDELGGWDEHCSPCPHFGDLVSPLDLGRGDPPPGSGGPAAAAAPASPSVDEEPARVVITPRQKEVGDQALAALARAGFLFERGRSLVEVIGRTTLYDKGDDRPGPAPGAAVIRPVRAAHLQEELASHCVFLVPKGGVESEDLKTVHPPRWLTRALLARGSWPELPKLAGLVEGPVLRPDGSILEAPGWDPSTGLYHVPSTRYAPVPETPSSADCQQALDLLSEVVGEFRFERPAHFAAWLSCLLTPLARPAFEGPAPVHVLGGGASRGSRELLALATSVVITGRRAVHVQADRAKPQEIDRLARADTRLALIDEASAAARSALLTEATNVDTWRARLPGTSEAVELPLHVVWLALTNGYCDSFLDGRVIEIRLSSFEQPRVDEPVSTQSDLLVWIRRRRDRIVPAALTLLRAYLTAGRPNLGLTAMGVRQGWSDLVRSTLVWHGVGDPVDPKESETVPSVVVGPSPSAPAAVSATHPRGETR